jgi:3',5'-cyclic AMP phosphodiesterase CpdA
MNIETLLENIESECSAGRIGGDVLLTAKSISKTVKSFLSSNSVGTESLSGGKFELNKSFGLEAFESLGTNAIISLVDEANVPKHFRGAAASSIASMVYRAAKAGADFTSVAAEQSKAIETSKSGVIGVESLLPESASRFHVGQEAFGATSDKVVADLQVAITVSLLKWHNSITPRVLSNIPTTEPSVNYIREELTVFQLEEDVEHDKSLIDLYEDPELITNQLTKIIPLADNDDSGEIVLSDGILAFGKEARLLALGTDADKFGHTKYNRTDIVADGVKLETVYVTINADVDDTNEAAETFAIQIPDSRSRLTRANNQLSTMRTANISFVATLDVDTKTSAGETSDNLSTLLGSTGDKLVLKLEVTPRIDIRDGRTVTLGSVSISAVSSEGGDADSATETAVDTAAIALYGYALDARYAEENIRKSNLATTTERMQLVYEIPQGRNYILDTPLNGPTVDRSQNISNLHNVIRIGQDNVVLKTMEAVLKDIGVATEAYLVDPRRENRPGAQYAAGGRVRPTYIYDEIDMTGIDSFDDSRRQEAIQGRVLTFLNAVCQQLMAKSFFSQQLDGNTPPTFRLVTSPTILGNIVGAKPGEFQQENANGVELTLRMTSGIVLECITSTFDYIEGGIMIVPFLSNDPASDLNFGHNRDFGTVVGSYTHNESGAAYQRLLANIRELPVPTNVIGAMIDVTGVDVAVYRAEDTSA